MSDRKRVLAMVMAGALLLAAGLGPRLGRPARAVPEPGAGPPGVTIPYPGHLALASPSDGAGQPVADGAYAFAFTLYEAETGGEPLWSETQDGVAVQGGAFTVLLGSATPLSPDLLGSGERWLAVAVRGPGEAGFTALNPRQSLSAAPAAPSSPTAGAACPHDHWGETWNGSLTGLILSGGWLGLSGTGTGYGLYGQSSTTTGVGVAGWATAASGENAGVFGQSDSTGGRGVYGVNSRSGFGAFGRSSTGFGLGAEGGGDSSGTDLVGDLELGGTRGEIFTFGDYLNIYSNWNINLDLDNDNNNSNAALRVWNGEENQVFRVEEDGDLWISGTLSKGALAFRIDHPLDPEKMYLNHSGVESPDMMNIYNGNVTLDANGEAWVELPEWFEALNQDFRYQLTPVGAPMPNLYIAQTIQHNRFQIAGGAPGQEVSWQVTGIRHDPYAEAHRIPVEEEKPPEERGTYLHPIEYGKPETLVPDYQRDQR